MNKSSHSQLLQSSPKLAMMWGLGQGTERRFKVLPQGACVQGTHAKVCIAHLGSDSAHKDHKFTGSFWTEQEVGYQGAYFSEN